MDKNSDNNERPTSSYSVPEVVPKSRNSSDLTLSITMTTNTKEISNPNDDSVCTKDTITNTNTNTNSVNTSTITSDNTRGITNSITPTIEEDEKKDLVEMSNTSNDNNNKVNEIKDQNELNGANEPPSQVQLKKNPSTVDLKAEEGIKCKDSVKIILLVLFIGIMVYLTIFSDALDISNMLLTLLRFFKKHKWEVIPIIYFIYVFAVVIPIPIKTILAITMGYLYGFPLGYLIMYCSALSGCIVSFLISRYGCQSFIGRVMVTLEKKLRKRFVKDENKKIITLEKSKILLEKEPIKATIILVISPIPMEWLNYIAGNSKIKFIPYLKGLCVGRLTAKSGIYVYLGSTANSLKKIANGKVGTTTVISLSITGVLFIFAIIFSVFLYKRANDWIDENGNRKLNDMVKRNDSIISHNMCETPNGKNDFTKISFEKSQNMSDISNEKSDFGRVPIESNIISSNTNTINENTMTI